MPNIHAINAQDTEYGITAENGITQEQSAKIETIGEVTALTTTAKQDIVSATNEVNEKATDNEANIGDLSTLITSVKTTLVGAINSEQEVLDRILNSYGKNVTSSIDNSWIADIDTQANSAATYTVFTLFSQSDLEGFLIGWKKQNNGVNAFFMYGSIMGVAFRRNGTWSFYSILNEPV